MGNKARDLANTAVQKGIQKGKDIHMGVRDQVDDLHQTAMTHAGNAVQMASDFKSQAVAKGMTMTSKANEHLGKALSHANDALMHAKNRSTDAYNTSMDHFATAMGNAGAAGAAEIAGNTKMEDASFGDHVNAGFAKLGTHGQKALDGAKGWLNGLGFGKSDNDASVAAPVAPSVAGPGTGGRRRRRTRKARKSRKHPKKGQKSRTMKGRKDFTTKKGNKKYNRRGHRQSKNAKGKRGRPYRTRKARKH